MMGFGDADIRLHLAADGKPHQHLSSSTQFLPAGCSSWRQTNSVEALKAQEQE